MTEYIRRFVIYDEAGDRFMGEAMLWTEQLENARLFTYQPLLPANTNGPLSVIKINFEAINVEEVDRA